MAKKGMKNRTGAPERAAAMRAGMALALLMLAAGARAADGPPPVAEPPERRAGTEAARQSDAREPLPLREFTDPKGRTCRVYAQRIIIEGGEQTVLATVCREANGRWVLSR